MVRALGRLLGDNTSLLKEVDFDVSTSKLAGGLEVDSNELALAKRNEMWMALQSKRIAVRGFYLMRNCSGSFLVVCVCSV